MLALLAAVPASGSSACTIAGAAGADHLVGTPHDDVICGRGGADTIEGRGGDDRLIGGPGGDTLAGGPGRDSLIGGPGDDQLRGGPGSDLLSGGPGSNQCYDGSHLSTSGCGTTRPVRTWPSPSPPRPPQGPPPSRVEPVIDTSAPSLQAVDFSTENVEIAQGDWWVDVSLSAWDESGIESAEVTIEGPDGTWQEVSLGADPGPLAKVRARVDVPATTGVGEYRVTAVTISDEAGNSVSRDEAWLAANGIEAKFEVYDGPDREAPNVAAISFRPGEVIDTGAGPVTVEIPIEVTDPGSGVEWVRLRVANPTSKQGQERIYTAAVSLVSGNTRDGTWLATIELPEGSVAGFYRVDELALADADEHHRYLAAADLEDDDLPGGFTQAGTPDTIRPRITSFSIVPQVVHTAAGEREVDFEIGIEDDRSGVNAWLDPVSQVSFTLTPPNWPVTWGMSGASPVLVTGTYRDGTWLIKRWLREDAGFGTWTVRWISVTDRAGNTTRLEDGSLEDFEAEGWDLSFENLP